MLTQDVIDALIAPVTEGSSCGDDLEYDAAFIALESAAQRKPEQQFGDTVIPAVEPEWQRVQEQAIALLQRTKDVRPSVLLLRAATRTQGVQGFVLGLQLLASLLERYWDGIHPALDADDGNDPTMRLNALAPLNDDALVVRDLYDAVLGDARGIGVIRVRDVAIARNLLGSAESAYSAAQVEGALPQILASHPQTLLSMRQVSSGLAQLQQTIATLSGRSDALDCARLRAIGKLLAQIAGDAPNEAGSTTAGTMATGAEASTSPAAVAQAVSVPQGAIQSRHDAMLLLDKVIHYLEQTEPGNPAPLLIARAKQLIGVSFLDIIHNLAPDAMATIEQVTGAHPAASSSE